MSFRQLPVLPLVFVLLVCYFFIGLIVLGQPSPNMYQNTRMPTAKGKESKRLFKQNCAKCHGPNGKGQTAAGKLAGAPDFTDPEWQEAFDDSQLENSITHGDGQMPAFGKKLSKAQIDSLVRYVRAFRARGSG
jgi:mono/diheme cytochrome c family protein